MIATRTATLIIADDFKNAVKDRAIVTLDPEEATPALLAGTPVIVLGVPTINEDTGGSYRLEWETAVIGAPVGDQAAAWQTLDDLLTLIDPVIEWDSMRPITWQGAQTASAPAYLITHSSIEYKGDPRL